jgi:hypothetical protein
VRVRARIGVTQAALAQGSLVLSPAVLETGGWLIATLSTVAAAPEGIECCIALQRPLQRSRAPRGVRSFPGSRAVAARRSNWWNCNAPTVANAVLCSKERRKRSQTSSSGGRSTGSAVLLALRFMSAIVAAWGLG